MQKYKQRKQRHSLCENNENNATHYVKLCQTRRESFKRNYYIIPPRVITKDIIIIKETHKGGEKNYPRGLGVDPFPAPRRQLEHCNHFCWHHQTRRRHWWYHVLSFDTHKLEHNYGVLQECCFGKPPNHSETRFCKFSSDLLWYRFYSTKVHVHVARTKWLFLRYCIRLKILQVLDENLSHYSRF